MGDPGGKDCRRARGERPAGIGNPGLGPGLLDGPGGLQPGHGADRTGEELRQEGGHPDLRHRLRPCRPGDGPQRQLFEEGNRRDRFGREAEAVFRAQGRPLPDPQADPRADRVRPAEPHRRPALLEAGPDQLPQPADVSRAARAAEDHRPVSLRAARRGVSCFSALPKPRATGKTSSSRSRRNGGSIDASASAARQASKSPSAPRARPSPPRARSPLRQR